MQAREALPPAWLAAAAALAGLSAGVLLGRGGPAPAPIPDRKPLAIPGAPPPEIAAALGDAIPGAFGATPDDAAFARVKDLVARWAAASPRDPLASAPWWKAALRRALPTGAGHPRGLFRTTVASVGGETPLDLSVPAGEGPFPAILAVLDGGEIPALYGDLLRSHLVVGVPYDDSVAGDPRIALADLAEIRSRYPVDPDRVVLDGTGRGAAVAADLAADAVREIAGVVPRDGSAASVPPRPSSDPRRPVAWSSTTGDRFRSWGPGFVVRRCRETAAGRPVSVRMSRDPAANAVALETANVAEILLLLTDEGLDLDRPVRVIVNGTVLHEKPVPRSLDAVRAWCTRGEPGLFVAAELPLRIPE